MRRHISVIAFIYGIGGVLTALLGVVIVVFGVGGGALAAIGGSGQEGGIIAVLGGFIGVIVIVGGALSALTGYGLMSRATWGRVMGVILAVLNLLTFSWWSLFGIYGLWVLLSKESGKEFS